MLSELAATIDALRPGRRALVAIDGADAAGKTTFAAALVAQLRRPVVTASIDGWHQPHQHRVRRGALSPEGYYRDAFDIASFRAQLLEPFAAGAYAVVTACFDYRADRPDVVRVEGVPEDAVLVCEGVFLLRPELRGGWDLSVYLHVPPDVTVARALLRDPSATRERYERRYLPAHELYRNDEDPLAAADLVIDNSGPPVLMAGAGLAP